MSGRVIDLRSDTVTKPTEAMRRAMASAEVGDDVYGEDPTVNLLEKRAAEMLGKQAALFVPTGTMGNTIAVKLHTEPGQEVICDDRAHVLDWELAMTAWFSGCLIRSISTPDGIMTWEQIEAQIKPGNGFYAPTALVTIEHPHNMHGGTLYDLASIDNMCDRAHARGLKVHIDGARIFNASIASGHSVARIAQQADTAMFCLSKGLGAPAGSMLVGASDAIARARHLRKRLGGGMRQAGVLAAAGLIAMEEMPARLHEDHANARWIAEQLAKIPCLSLDLNKVRTNVVVFDISGAGLSFAELSAQLRSKGLLISTAGGMRARVLTHLNVSRKDCETAVRVMEEVLAPVCAPKVI
jgi:threonine aldolase